MKKRGFTLIEMLIVIVIIGILAGALIPRIGNARDKANDVAREANVKSIATAMSQSIMDGNDVACSGFAVPFAGLARYGITSSLNNQPQNGDTYNCAIIKDNHFVVWTTSVTDDENGVDGAANCLSTDMVAANLGTGASFATVTQYVDKTLEANTYFDAYCMVQ